MDAGALELHLRRLPGVVACQLTPAEAVLLLAGGDPVAVRIAAQAALDQAGSTRAIRVLSAAPPIAPPLWRRRRFAVLAGAAGALSAGLAAASTLASMPGAVAPSREAAIEVPEAEARVGGRQEVRTLVPAPVQAPPADPPPATGDVASDEAGAPAESAVMVGASPPLAGTGSSPVASPPAPPAVPGETDTPAPAPPPAPAPAPAPSTGVVAASADEGDDPKGRGRGRDRGRGERAGHPHGNPPGHLQRAGHGPW